MSQLPPRIPPEPPRTPKHSRGRLINCHDCGASISRAATACPHCGRPNTTSTPRYGLWSCGVIAVGILWAMCAGGGNRSDRPTGTPPPPVASVSTNAGAVRERLLYLSDLPGVEWYVVNGNNVYIGFSTAPDRQELDTIIRAAALHGHRAHGSGFHAWAVPASNRSFNPSTDQWYAEATARYGKVQDATVH